jgi:S-adenosylmethionine:tRNA ribosyltransferase-isomerase
MYRLDDYDYELPAELIAQQPVPQRDQSRLLVLDRRSGVICHRRFENVRDWLHPGDVLVVNDTEVVPARLVGRKASGGRVEALLLDFTGDEDRGPENGYVGRCLLKSSKPPQVGTRLIFDQNLEARVLGGVNGTYRLAFSSPEPFADVLYRIGRVPLPPYIRREAGQAAPCDDRRAYQTVYAARKGAVAAPTAGLHFTPRLLSQIRSRGVRIVSLTLHVGYGTFVPVRVADVRQHRMHAERFRLSPDAARTINQARAQGRRIVAVGTTAVRTLEYAADAAGRVLSASGSCDLFIYPGYGFKVIDALITNFHLPRSTLLLLVSAFAGRDAIMAAYREAVHRRYRFFSYGDAMLIC